MKSAGAEKALPAHADRSCRATMICSMATSLQRHFNHHWIGKCRMGDLFFDLANFSDHSRPGRMSKDRWLWNIIFNEEATPDHWPT